MAGSPEKVIDLVELEKLCKMQCTDEEIAAWFNISRTRFVLNHKRKKAVIEAMERGRAKGRASLRHAQFAKAMEGHPALLIWLGKQILGQRDQVFAEHTADASFNDAAKQQLLSKLAGLVVNREAEESDQSIN